MTPLFQYLPHAHWLMRSGITAAFFYYLIMKFLEFSGNAVLHGDMDLSLTDLSIADLSITDLSIRDPSDLSNHLLLLLGDIRKGGLSTQVFLPLVMTYFAIFRPYLAASQRD